MSYRKVLRTIAITFIVGCIIYFASQPIPLWAGGLYLEEFGTPSMGVASAGAEAVAADASSALHNPAGMTRLDGKQLMITGGLAYSRVKFDQDSGNIGSGAHGRRVLNAQPFRGFEGRA